MNQRNIVNIINFIRGVEPRDPAMDLLEPVINQIRLVQEHGLAATWLVQYDALIDDRFASLLKDLDDSQEIGGWFEIVQPQVEKAGLKWRGRPGYAWDWHAHVGFSAGYTPAEREKLADVFMEEFKEVFGKYPRSVGSWFIDAHLLGYLADRYGVIASCNCKDQWGTDGYTLWGGYYNQAYYPSRKNSFVPAQHSENQIPIPIFRMLGSDPIYQYDAGIRPGFSGQPVITLEPVYEGIGGGSPEWVRWFFDVIFQSPALSFGYTQVGQENSFGWGAMSKALTYQIELLEQKSDAGEVCVETLGDSSEWFKSKYPVTPSSSIVALKDWKAEDRKSVWYNSRFYRTNLFWENNTLRIRDIRIFDENYEERYLNSVLTSPPSVYDTLPVMDGLLWSDETSVAGIRLVEIRPDGTHSSIKVGDPAVTESGDDLIVSWELPGEGTAKAVCSPDSMCITMPPSKDSKWGMAMSWAGSKSVPIQRVEESCIHYTYEGFSYDVTCANGKFEYAPDGSSILILPDDSGSIRLKFDR